MRCYLRWWRKQLTPEAVEAERERQRRRYRKEKQPALDPEIARRVEVLRAKASIRRQIAAGQLVLAKPKSRELSTPDPEARNTMPVPDLPDTKDHRA